MPLGLHSLPSVLPSSQMVPSRGTEEIARPQRCSGHDAQGSIQEEGRALAQLQLFQPYLILDEGHPCSRLHLPLTLIL